MVWTLADARSRVTARLAEESTVFWDESMRNRAINDAQRFIATLTKGVEKAYAGTSGPGLFSYVTFKPDSIVGVNNAYALVTGQHYGRIPSVPVEVANIVDPSWERQDWGGTPKWLVVDVTGGTASIVPRPTVSTQWEARLRILPAEANNDSDELFAGEESMARYLNPLVNLACAYLLLQERFEQDAERFYGFAVNELTALGQDSASIPPLANAQGGGQ